MKGKTRSLCQNTSCNQKSTLEGCLRVEDSMWVLVLLMLVYAN